MASKEIPNNALWGVDSALSMNRAFAIVKEFYIPEEFSSLVVSLEFYDPLEFGAYSDCDYRSSLVEVASLSGFKRAERASLRKKVLKGLSFTSVSAISIIALVNASKPTLSDVALVKEEAEVTYSFTLHYKKATTLHLVFEDGGKETTEDVLCPWDESVPLTGLTRAKSVEGRFALGNGSYRLTIQARFGFGMMSLWSKQG
jgi:hypothetical protein